MTQHRSAFRKLALTTFLFSLPLNAAFAQDATAVAERLKSVLAGQNLTLAWTSVTGDASEAVLEGTSIQMAGEGKPLSIGKLTLSGITEENRGFKIETITTEPYSLNEGPTKVEISPLTLGNVSLPATDSTDLLASFLMYETANLDNVSVKIGDKQAFQMTNFAAEVTPPADGNAMEFTGSAEKFTADLTLVEDPQSKAAIEALGYQNISGDFQMEGTWQPTDGRMALSSYDITVDNAGTLGMTFDLGGYTVEFLKSVQELQKKMAAQPEGADNSAQGMAMLGLMQQLTFNGATVRFDDDSVTNKVLEYVAKQQNMTAKDIANQAKAIVPFLMMELNNPELSTQVTAAVNAYLDAPKSIEIAAKPASPVPFALLAASGMSNPKDLPKTLGLTVTANQD
ncbi:hypothetical protein EDC40_10536 [Aminobacter aminovorans]|uniref:DUF945 domain-containing protein n=1 Tax=Aminobacter aminovorans TaxID=83263 RepID=A0A380WQ95_AMIAI|nr:hypothetical protein [Aminobacter aminovorans]TCS25839.1 hypothetical protein EDC40_10536 [Aminobacter aminovorans]SUU90496.1 Uncharacterised protein [Aminobacter aminovorans]